MFSFTFLLLGALAVQTLVKAEEARPCYTKGTPTPTCTDTDLNIDDLLKKHENDPWSFDTYDCEDVNTTETCQAWKQNGECYNYPIFMIENCGKTCGFCHLRNDTTRCRRPDFMEPALDKGSIDFLFIRALHEYRHYSPKIISKDPWLITFDNLFTAKEAQQIVNAAGGENGTRFKRSWTVDYDYHADGTKTTIKHYSDIRTSETVFCNRHIECFDTPTVYRVTDLMSEIVWIPRENAEYLQVLRYNKDQYYNQHHDYITESTYTNTGGRILTFYLYLSDVEEGGGTFFPYINNGTVVQPKVGRAALWQNVDTADPWKPDPRTEHAALPVTKGTKYGANIWFHMYNYQWPYETDCTN